MKDVIVNAPGGITLVGGGRVRAADLSEALRHAPCPVAVDGGAASAIAHGVIPHAVIGDMDSLDDRLRAAIPAERLHRIAEQESTDFDKALRSLRAPLVIGVGFLGRRVDHQLANFNVLVRRASQRCILLGIRDLVFAAPGRVTMDLPPGSRLSLFPLCAMTGKAQGLDWPIDGLHMAPDGRIGTSNRVDGSGKVLLEFDSAGMLVILPKSALVAAISAVKESQPAAPAG